MAEAKKIQRIQHKMSSTQQGVGEQEEVDSENTESAFETESKSEESGSESTITDSCPENTSATIPISSSMEVKPLRGGKKTKPPPATGPSSGPGLRSGEAIELFISAAEALNNIVPPEVALHDHSYSLAPSSLVNSMELQGTSGLSLIAAAAAVVSPTLSRSASGTKLPLSPVRTTRGRPPNSQRKGSSNTTNKLAPTLLSPTGTCNSVLLTVKTGPPRVRTRSASDRPKLSTLHVPRPSSTLARMSINSSNRPVVMRGSSAATLLPPASYSKHKNDSNSSPSLKSMMAFHPPSSSSSSSSNNSNNTNNSGTSTSSTSAFEALVNVAVAAPPAELNQSSVSGSLHLPSTSSHSTANLKLSSSISVPSSSSSLTFTATTLPSSQPTVTLAVTGSNSNTSNSTGTTTAYLDVNQAINLLASLAQQHVASGTSNGNSQSMSVLPTQRLLTPVNLLGNIVPPGSKANSCGGLVASSLSNSKGAKFTWSDTLLGHLTSGISSQATSGKGIQSKVASGKGKKTATLKSDVSSSRNNSLSSSSGSTREQGSKMVGSGSPIVRTGEDMTNLNLLSSLVAAVAASSQPAAPSPQPLSATTSSAPQISEGQSSDVHGSETELNREYEFAAAATTAVTTSSVSSWSSSVGSSASLAVFSNSSSSISTHDSDESSFTSCGVKQQQQQQQKQQSLGVDIDMNTCITGPSYHASQSGMSSTSLSSSGSLDTGAVDDLPRSVVRSVLGSTAINKDDHTPASIDVPKTVNNIDNTLSSSTHFVTENDMTASLASIIPSMPTQQSSLLLYTRSISFPMSMTNEPSVEEEEDHLASATRGISELSKLLGTDSNSDSGCRTRQDSPVYKDVSTLGWNPSDLLNSTTLGGNGVVDSPDDFVSAQPESGAYLSSVLESQVHGTVHQSSLPTAAKLNKSSTNTNRESTMDMDHR